MARPKQLDFYKTAGTRWTEKFTVTSTVNPDLRTGWDLIISIDGDWHPTGTPEVELKLSDDQAYLAVDSVEHNAIWLNWTIPLGMFVQGKMRYVRIDLVKDGLTYPVCRGQFEVGP